MKNISKKGIEFLAELEGLKLNPYLCPAGIPSIGLGNTFYPDGKKVTLKDKPITKEQAYELFHSIAKSFEKTLNDNVPSDLTQAQFDALFCFCYNVGQSAFLKSTLLKKVNVHPNDVGSITQSFLLWKGKNNILLNRQRKQIKFYFEQ